MLVQEKKWVANFVEKDFALKWLNQVCIPDTEYPTGLVKSIYYDTPMLKNYREKSNGDYLKSKVRIRWYGTGSSDETITAFAEMKAKTGSGREKIRKKFLINRKWIETTPLHDPKLVNYIYKEEFQGVFPLNMLPVLTIIYDRHRFICPFTKARVCLDFNIHTERFHSHLFSFISENHSVFFNFVVLEIKDNVKEEEIPWLLPLYERGFRSISVSKYGTGISKFIKGELV